MCVLSIKVPIRKKSGNLFNDPHSLCGDTDEIITHIISECCKLSCKEYKTRHEWVGKVIYWELCKKKIDDLNKWYMHNPESVLVNMTHELLRDFETQRDHLISAWRSDLVIVNNSKNKYLPNRGLCHSGWPQSKIKESEKSDKYFHFAWEQKIYWTWKWQWYQS